MQHNNEQERWLRSRVLFIISALSCAFVVILVVAPSVRGVVVPQTQLDLNQLPIYPNASLVQIGDENRVRKTSKYGPLFIATHQISFRTHDSRDMIIKFYHDELQKTGWRSGDWGPPGGASINNPISYYWPTASTPRIKLTITVKDVYATSERDPDYTDVTIVVEQEPATYPSPLEPLTAPSPVPTQASRLTID